MVWLKGIYNDYTMDHIALVTAHSTQEEIKSRDYNKIGNFLYIQFTLKIFRMFLIIVSISYFSAMLFKIVLEVEEDMYGHITLTYCDDAVGWFKGCYELWDQSAMDVTIQLLYFTFTTLSTVGFGDFSPKSNLERMLLAFGMLLGVAIFSILMGEFIEMLDEIKDVQSDFEEGDQLARFFGVLTTFNRGNQINIKLKRRVE